MTPANAINFKVVSLQTSSSVLWVMRSMPVLKGAVKALAIGIIKFNIINAGVLIEQSWNS